MHRTLRRLGELMEVMPKAKPPGGSKKYPKKDRVVSGPDPLLDLGIDKHLADRARKAAAMPDPKQVTADEIAASGGLTKVAVWSAASRLVLAKEITRVHSGVYTLDTSVQKSPPRQEAGHGALLTIEAFQPLTPGGQLLIHDLRMGEFLEYERPRAFRQLVRIHRKALEEIEPLHVTALSRGAEPTSGDDEDNIEEFWLTRKPAPATARLAPLRRESSHR